MRKRTNRIWRKGVQDTRGAALIEFTLVLPILLSLALGVTEFGRMIQHHHVVQKGVRDAARYLARVDIGNTTCTKDANWNAKEVIAKDLAMKGSTDPAATLILNYWTNPTTITVALNCYNITADDFRGRENSSTIPRVEVTAIVPYQDIGLLEVLGFGPLTFTLAHEEMNFGE